ncbi:MAG: caspase family protein [Armatimonadetes bacterium]|nr:caspase family protein [Armatimonadota bacterium]
MTYRWIFVTLIACTAGAAETFSVAAGVEQYDDPAISGLHYAVSDATALADAFRRAGVPAANVRLLTSGARNRLDLPTKFGLLRALQSVREKARAGDVVVFFYAGHGMQTAGTPYLLAMDTFRERLEGTGLALEDITQTLCTGEAKQVLILFDACRNDPNAGRAEGDAHLDDGFARGLRPVLVRGEPAPANPVVLLACDVGQRAWEMPDERHGVFTHYVLEALGGAAAGAGQPVSVQSLAGYVQKEVGAWAARANRAQTPRLENPEKLEFPLLLPAAAATPATGQPAAPRAAGKCVEINNGVAIERLVADPATATVWVHCQPADLSTVQARALDEWVRAGHRVVVENQLAESYGFRLERAVLSLTAESVSLAALKPGSHPVLDGVRQVSLKPLSMMTVQSPSAATGHPDGVPLLVDSSNWASSPLCLARWGRGEVLFRTTAPFSDGYDAGPLQRNLADYLTRPPTPPLMPPPLDAPARSEVANIVSSNAVEAYAADPAYVTLVIWAPAGRFTSGQRDALTAWVKQGGRVVLRDEAAAWFGFQVRDYPFGAEEFVAPDPDGHPLVRSVQRVVAGNELSWPGIMGGGNAVSYKVVASPPGCRGLLCDKATGKSFFLAVAPFGQGEAVFRTWSCRLLKDAYDKQQLTQNMDDYWKTPVPAP